MNMQLSEVLQNIPIVQIKGKGAGNVTSVCYDSRKCEKDSMFVAICGMKHDGHAFIPDAVRRGARFIVHEEDISVDHPGVTSIRVSDSRRVLGLIGKNFFKDPSANLCILGVTGTNGKTTVTYLLESILNAAGYSTGVLGTINYRFKSSVFPAPHTTPESFELQRILRNMADAGVTHVVMEVSSHAIDLKRIDDCSFDIGIFTNLSQDHLDYHGTMDKYFEAKKRFFDEILPLDTSQKAKTMIVNGDDPWGRKLLTCDWRGIEVRAYGLENRCDVTADRYCFSLDGISADILAKSTRFPVVSSLIGAFNLYNILAAAAAALELNIPEECIQRGIKNLTTVPGRLEMVSGVHEPKVFVDYAHTEDALRRVLQNLSSYKKGRILTVFGCGGDRDRGKRPKMGKVVTEFSDFTIITSDNPRSEDPLTIINDIEAGIPTDSVKKCLPGELWQGNEKAYTVIPDRKDAIRTAIHLADPADIVLIAGKGHENYQIIGHQYFPFDDRSVARSALAEKYGAPVK